MAWYNFGLGADVSAKAPGSGKITIQSLSIDWGDTPTSTPNGLATSIRRRTQPQWIQRKIARTHVEVGTTRQPVMARSTTLRAKSRAAFSGSQRAENFAASHQIRRKQHRRVIRRSPLAGGGGLGGGGEPGSVVIRNLTLTFKAAAGSGDMAFRKRAYAIAGNDQYERQALANERAIAQAIGGGAAGGMHLDVTHAGGAGTIHRKAGDEQKAATRSAFAGIKSGLNSLRRLVSGSDDDDHQRTFGEFTAGAPLGSNRKTDSRINAINEHFDAFFGRPVSFEELEAIFTPEAAGWSAEIVTCSLRAGGTQLAVTVRLKNGTGGSGTVKRLLTREASGAFVLTNEESQIDPSASGTNYTRGLYARQESFLRGISSHADTRCELHADLAAGPYLWAMHGYSFQDRGNKAPKLDHFQKEWKTFLEGHGIKLSDAKLATFTEPFHFATYDSGKKVEHKIYVCAHCNRPMHQNRKGWVRCAWWCNVGGDTDEKHWDPTGKQQPSKVIQVHLGKKFMLTGSHWFGVRHVNKANAGDSVGDAYRNGQAPLVQRKAHSVLRKADAFAARIQRKAGGVGGGNDFDSHLQRSSGGSLPAGLNSKMSGWLGSDFSGVRVHTDTAAQKACAAVNAEAFTLGNDVYFGKGFYNTSSAKGVALIGHELTHVAQNMGGAKTISPKEVRRKAEIRRSELSGVAEIRRKQGYTIAGNDRHEKQAVSNERMIAGEIRRKEDGGFADYAWDRIKDGSIRDQVFGIAYGLGLDVGNPTAGDDDSFASFLWERVVAGGVSDQIFAYAEGLGTGVTNAVEGTYELLTTDPRKTYAAVEKAIDNHELVYAAIKDKLAEYADARNDPEKFARMTGVLVGEILAGIAADKGIGKVGSVVKGTRAGAATFNAAGKVVRLPLKVVSAMVLALRTVGTKFPEIRKTLAKTLPPDSLPDLDQAIDLQRAKEVQAPKRKVITVAKIQEAIRKQRGLSVSYDEIKARLRKRFPERHWERLDEILLDEFNLEKNAVSKANQYAIKVGANSVEMGGESFELTKGRGRGGTFVWELPGHKGIGRSRAGDWAKVEVEEAIDIVDGAAVKRLHIHGIYNSKTLPPGLMRNLMRELIVESNLDDFGSISGTVANDLTNEVISKFDGGPIPSSALSDTKLGKMREFIAESSGYRVTGHSWDSNLHQLVTHVEKQVKAPELPTKGGKLGAIIPDEALRTLNNDPMGWFPETPQRGLDWAKVEKFRDLFAGGEELKMTVENGMDTAVSISGITGNGGRAVMNGQHRVAGYFLAHGRWPDLDNLHVHENKPEYGLTYSYKPWFPEADQTISRKYSGAGMGLGSGDFDGHLRQSTGGSLPGDLGTQMSGWLGADFSGVRIHTDTAAQRACAAVNAEAFTIGSSVYFGKGFYSPSSAKGVALIGHELTHVAQNIGGAKTISPKELRRKEAIRRSELSERATSIQRKEEGFGSFFWSRLKSGEVRDDMYNGILAPFTTIGAAGTFFYGIATSDPFEVMGNGTPTEVEAVLLLLKGRKTITPDIIYAAARQVAGTNRAALRLSLKVVLEHAYSLPLAQIAGIDARNKDINDKYKHFFSCAVIASFGSSHGATLTGYLKEAMDEMSTDRGFDDDDMIANRAGARFGYLRRSAIQGTVLRRKAYTIAPHDRFEEQAHANERAIAQAYRSGGGLSGSGAGVSRMPSARASLQRSPMGSFTPLYLKAGDDENDNQMLPIMDGAIAELANLMRAAGPFLGATADIGISLIPIVGDVYDMLCGLVGKSLFTWQNLNVFERILCFVGVIPIPFVSGALLRRGGSWLARLLSEKKAYNILSTLIEKGTKLVKKYVGKVKAWLRDTIANSKLLARNVKAWARKNLPHMKRPELGKIDANPETYKRYKEFVDSGLYSKAMSKQMAEKGAIFSVTEDLGLIYDSGRVWGRADGAVYGMAVDGAHPLRGMAGIKQAKNDKGKIVYVGQAAEQFNKHCVEGLWSGLKRALGQHKSKFGDLKFDPEKAIFDRKNNLLIISEAEIVPHAAANSSSLSKLLPDGMWTEAHSNMWAKSKVFGRSVVLEPLFITAAATVATGGDILHPLFDLIQMLCKDGDGPGDGATAFADRMRDKFSEVDPEAWTDEWSSLSSREQRRLSRLTGDADELRQPGLPLEMRVRQRLESYLGEDLSAVRVHTGLHAERMTRAVDAEAFTIGQHIFLGAGTDMDSPEGLGLMAHEATHAVQDRAGQVGEFDTRSLEMEAHAVEHAVVAQARYTAPTPIPEPVYRAPAAASAPDLPAPSAPAPPPTTSPMLRKKKDGRPGDPIQRIMEVYDSGASMSPEEFVETCREQILDMMRDELEYDNERRETLAWNYHLPQM